MTVGIAVLAFTAVPPMSALTDSAPAATTLQPSLTSMHRLEVLELLGFIGIGPYYSCFFCKIYPIKYADSALPSNMYHTYLTLD